MPKYDYGCSYCEVIREYEHPMDTNYNGITCSFCKIGMLFKKYRPAATHFKGQGWGGVYRNHKPKDIT